MWPVTLRWCSAQWTRPGPQEPPPPPTGSSLAVSRLLTAWPFPDISPPQACRRCCTSRASRTMLRQGKNLLAASCLSSRMRGGCGFQVPLSTSRWPPKLPASAAGGALLRRHRPRTCRGRIPVASAAGHFPSFQPSPGSWPVKF